MGLPAPIFTYTRAEAIADGVLVDLTEWASGDKGFLGGYSIPVAATHAVWAMIESIPPAHRLASVRGRAHDVLWMSTFAARRIRGEGSALFKVILPTRESPRGTKVLKLHLGPGDDGQPVATIMLRDED